jgi:hypothetical protein
MVAQVTAAERWHFPHSPEVLGARQRLIEADRLVASAQLALKQAEQAAGVWGEG